MEHVNSVAKSLRKRKLTLKAKGLCCDCGKFPFVEKKTLCQDCLNKRKIREKLRMRKLGRCNVIMPTKCNICQEPLIYETAVLDHCHSAMRLRGWLCRACNVGLGMFKDNAENLLRAIQYLQKPHGEALAEVFESKPDRN